MGCETIYDLGGRFGAEDTFSVVARGQIQNFIFKLDLPWVRSTYFLVSRFENEVGVLAQSGRGYGTELATKHRARYLDPEVRSRSVAMAPSLVS